ncbi:MAG: phytoene/squalene synthase family protein [Bacteroidota bacterium]
MELYTKTCTEISKKITHNYSTSFTLGIRTLHKKLHDPIYAIYGFVRIADEIVDTFHEHNKTSLLAKFKADTYESLVQRISTNPVLHAFQEVVHQYNIDLELIEAFLNSMEMDLHHATYDDNKYNEYIYGSAEVVGLMCLKVFCNGNQAEYDRLKSPAKHLGAAFQKVNFLRDMKSDYAERGRVYFPEVDFNFFCDQTKLKLEKEIEEDFKKAYQGIKELPIEARFGVYVAYIYYQALLRKIKKVPASTIKDARIRVPNKEKFALLLSSWFRFQLNVI